MASRESLNDSQRFLGVSLPQYHCLQLWHKVCHQYGHCPVSRAEDSTQHAALLEDRCCRFCGWKSIIQIVQGWRFFANNQRCQRRHAALLGSLSSRRCVPLLFRVFRCNLGIIPAQNSLLWICMMHSPVSVRSVSQECLLQPLMQVFYKWCFWPHVLVSQGLVRANRHGGLHKDTTGTILKPIELELHGDSGF